MLTVLNCTFSANHATVGGAGIWNRNGAALGVMNSTFSVNSAGTGGGGIINYGTAVVAGSTFSGNSAGMAGGAIVDYGTLALAGTTISANNAAAVGGGIAEYGTLTVTNSILAGNTGGDCFESGSVCPTNGSNGNLVGVSAIGLSPPGNYGGPTQTLIPLPGSPAICAGLAANVPGGVTTDQRGEANTNANYPGYSTGTACVDAGAVQTNYSLKFVQQPSTVVQNATMSPAPTVELDESGTAFFDGADTMAIPLALTTGSGTVTGGLASTLTTTGVATYSGLSISLPGSNDVLTASLTLNPALSPALSVSQASVPFNVNSAVTQLAFGTLPPATITAGGNAGAAVVVDEENAGGTTVTTASDTITLTVTGPNSYSRSYTQAAVSGAATFDLSGAALTVAGSYSFTASISTDPSITTATASENVSAGSAATVAVGSGSGQSAKIGAAFASLLEVKVEDGNGNPVQSAKVTFTAPSSGAGATISGSPATTASDGTASVTATANGTAGAAAYTVTASVSGATSASFSLTNTQQSTTLTVTSSPSAPVYGQPVTITAAISPSAVAGSSPSGTVTFYDSSTALTPSSAVTSSSAGYTVSVPAVGSHGYAAQYAGDTNFTTSALTPAASALVVGKAGSTLNGPASPVSVIYGSGGTIEVAIAGQYAGPGIATPSGSVTYTIGSGAAQTAVIASGTASLSIPASQAAGKLCRHRELQR